MPVPKKIIFFLILVILAAGAILFSPDDFSEKETVVSGDPVFRREELFFTTSSGEKVSLLLEIADDQEKRSAGLMGRKELLDTDGMLFVFPEEVEYGFWMKDTYIPLSIAFIDTEGTLLEILEMEVCQEKDQCPVYYPGGKYRYAVELPQGDFVRLGIGTGDKMDLPKP